MTADQGGEEIDERIRAIMVEGVADRFFMLSGRAECIRNGSSRTISCTRDLEMFTAVLDALAADLGQPHADPVRRMTEDLEARAALDRSALVHLYQMEEADRPGGRPEP